MEARAAAWLPLHQLKILSDFGGAPYGVRSAVTSRASRIVDLEPATRRQEASKFGQACCEQSRPDLADIKPVALGEHARNAGFDLWGKSGKNGEGGGEKRSNSDG